MGSGVSREKASNFDICSKIFIDFHAVIVAQMMHEMMRTGVYVIYVCVIGDADSRFNPVAYKNNAIRFYRKEDQQYIFCSNPGDREDTMKYVQNVIQELFLSAQGGEFSLKISVHWADVLFREQDGQLHIQGLPEPLYDEFKEEQNVAIYGPGCIFAMEGHLQIMRDHFVRVFYPKWALSKKHIIRIFERGQRNSDLLSLLEKRRGKVCCMLVVDDQRMVFKQFQNLVDKQVHIHHAVTSEGATKLVKRNRYDLILVDLMLGPEENGAEWVDTYKGDAFVVSMTSDRNLCSVIFSSRFDLVCSKGELYNLMQSR